MVKRVLFAALVAALLCMCSSAFAASSLEGPTGIVNVPSTDIPDPGKGEVALTWQDLEDDFSRTIVRGVYGIAPQWEVGALWNRIKDGEDTDIWGLNVKYRLMREPEQDYGLALGVSYEDISTDVEVGPPVEMPRASQVAADKDVKWTRLYLVASKILSVGADDEDAGLGQVTGLLGIVYDRAKLEGWGSDSDTNLMLGLEALTRNGTYVALEFRPSAEFEGFGEGDDIVSLVARRKVSENVCAELGWTNSVGPFGADKNKIFVGVSWAFGAGEEEED